MKTIHILYAVALVAVSCGSNTHKTGNPTADQLYAEQDSALARQEQYSDTITIRYARGLSVRYASDGVHVRICNPDPMADDTRVEEFVVTSPASRFICTTALQLGAFEVLGLEDRVVGINSLRNLFSPVIQQQIVDGQTVQIGREGTFDLETVIASQPDYIFVSASKHGGFEALRECGIPLITHYGYKETDPLGQAEWIKLVGLLTGETRRANAVFADVERKYLALKTEVMSLDSAARAEGNSSWRPTVVSGRQMRDGWYVVGGRSYMAQLFADAGADYVMSDVESSGGISLDFEAVYARAVDADFWQTDGSNEDMFSLQQLADEDPRYATLRAFRNNHVLYCNLAHTPYRELAGLQPHLVLADFVKAFHPEIMPNYVPHYYTPLQ